MAPNRKTGSAAMSSGPVPLADLLRERYGTNHVPRSDVLWGALMVCADCSHRIIDHDEVAMRCRRSGCRCDQNDRGLSSFADDRLGELGRALKLAGATLDAARAATDLDSDIDRLTELSARLAAALRKCADLGCIRMYWGAERPCAESNDGRELCGPCEARAALVPAPEAASHE